MQVLYFAWVRSKIGKGFDTIDTEEFSVTTVIELVDYLKSLGDNYSDAFSDLSLLRVAVNQDFCDWDSMVKNDDEVAFFPPVTGG